jgi:YT521-B-like domain
MRHSRFVISFLRWLICESSENVYLIFSANKSGEFYGYARMVSEIPDISSQQVPKPGDIQSETAAGPAVVLAGPKTTVTPRTNVAPRGKIFEDEARGTVFWEIAESSEDEEGIDESEQPRPDEKWGNPFRIEWIKWYKIIHNVN